MMDTSCVADPSASVAATPPPQPTTATTAAVPPTPTSHAQHLNPFISDTTTMPNIDQAQEGGLDICNGIHMIVNPLESSSLDAAMPLAAADDASTMPPPPPAIPGATKAAVGMPSFLTQSQTQTFETINGTNSPFPLAQHELTAEEQQQQHAQTSNIPTPAIAPASASPTWEESSSSYAISATPETVVSTPMPQSQIHEPAGVTSIHPQTVLHQRHPSVAAHSVVSPSATSTESGSIVYKAPMASLPPPSSSITSTKQMIGRTTPPTTNCTTIPSHHYLGPTSTTMHLNPPVPSNVPSNPSVEVGGIPHLPAATTASSTPAGIPQVSHPYPMGAPSTMSIMPPSSPPDSMSSPTICSSMAAGAAPTPVGSGGDTINTHPLSPKKKCPYPLRRGKWTTEEESYANRLIHEFKSGLLPLTDGTTLRNFLSKLLNCDPMRISKKFVGNNCIGKQVFRRKVPEINRLTPEQVQLMCVELSELERRFFDRVAQTNCVKSSGVATTLASGATMIGGPGTSATMNMINVGGKLVRDDTMDMEMKPPTPPWLRPPRTYKPKGKFARKLMMNKAAMNALSRCMPQKPMTDSMPTGKSRGSVVQSSTANDGIPRTESALEQLARTASAAKFVEDIVNGEIALGDSEGLGNKLSQSTLHGSFEALMSMDLQSVENLVELAATSNSSAILSELNKNYSESLKYNQSSANLSTRMESFIKSLSNANLFKTGFDSQQALGCLLNASCSNFFDAEKFFKKGESSTAFPQLSGEDGLDNGSHNSVEDFLSLVASGDIPHQDPNMLQVPLQKIMQGNGNGSTAGSKRKLSQQQLVALASRLAPGVNSTSKKRKKK